MPKPCLSPFLALAAALLVALPASAQSGGTLQKILTMGLLGGLLSRGFGFNTGVQFMGYYTAVLSVPALVKLF
jgi:hypothetical protein